MFVPLSVDVPMDRRPMANWALIGLIVCVTLVAWSEQSVFYGLTGQDRAGQVPGYVESPNDRLRHVILEAQGIRSVSLSAPPWKLPSVALTSAFVHVDVLHLLGNVLFLWVFGNAVNYKLGHLPFLGLYFLGAILSGLAWYWIVPGVAVAGASGAIMCVVGVFLVFFPRNDVTVVFSTSRVVWADFQLSGWMVILASIGWDILNFARGGEDGIAYPAHVAGFAIGVVAGWLLAGTDRFRPTRYEQTLRQVFGLD
jgi:membrane associated rhomboid family serine protease